MAIGMRTWLTLLVGGMVLVAVPLLPPEYRGPAVVRPISEQLRLQELNREVRVVEGILLRRALADSLAPMVVAGGVTSRVVDGPAVARWSGGGTTPFLTDSLRVEAEASLAFDLDRQPGPQRAAIGVFVRQRTVGSPVLFDAFAGSLDGTPYCFRVVSGSARMRTDGLHLRTWEGADALGPCRFYAQHGLPGPHVERWLKTGGAAFAAAPADDALYRTWEGTRVAPIASFRSSQPSVEPDRCLSGIGEACATMFLGVEVEAEEEVTYRVAAASPALSIGGSRFLSRLGPYDDYLLADLEAEFGSERFRAFWTSDLEVRPAFENAFGVDLGEWVLAWARATIGESAGVGPGLSRSAASGALLGLVLSGLFATALARRRRLA